MIQHHTARYLLEDRLGDPRFFDGNPYGLLRHTLRHQHFPLVRIDLHAARDRSSIVKQEGGEEMCFSIVLPLSNCYLTRRYVFA